MVDPVISMDPDMVNRRRECAEFSDEMLVRWNVVTRLVTVAFIKVKHYVPAPNPSADPNSLYFVKHVSTGLGANFRIDEEWASSAVRIGIDNSIIARLNQDFWKFEGNQTPGKTSAKIEHRNKLENVVEQEALVVCV